MEKRPGRGRGQEREGEREPWGVERERKKGERGLEGGEGERYGEEER